MPETLTACRLPQRHRRRGHRGRLSPHSGEPAAATHPVIDVPRVMDGVTAICGGPGYTRLSDWARQPVVRAGSANTDNGGIRRGSVVDAQVVDDLGDTGR